MERDHGAPAEGAASFHTTRWTIVRRAAQSRAQGYQSALAELCRNYWYALYMFARRRGHAMVGTRSCAIRRCTFRRPFPAHGPGKSRLFNPLWTCQSGSPRRRSWKPRSSTGEPLLEREGAVYPLPRAAHFDDEVMRVLQAIGLCDSILPYTHVSPGMRFVDLVHPGRFLLPELDEELGVSLYQRTVELYLWDGRQVGIAKVRAAIVPTAAREGWPHLSGAAEIYEEIPALCEALIASVSP